MEGEYESIRAITDCPPPELVKSQLRIGRLSAGYIERVMREEWDGYVRLRAFITYCDDPHHDRVLRPPYYHEVRRMAKLVRLPPQWRLYVPVDDSSPQVERLEHILGMLTDVSAMEEVRQRLSSYLIPHSSSEFDLSQLLVNPARDTMVDNLYAILRHNADLIRGTSQSYRKRLSLPCSYARILWGDIRELARLLDVTSLSTEEVTNTVNLLSGYGSRELRSIEVRTSLCPSSIEPDRELCQILSLSYSYLTPIPAIGLSLIVPGTVQSAPCSHTGTEGMVPLTSLLPIRIYGALLEVASNLPCNETKDNQERPIVLPIEYFKQAACEMTKVVGAQIVRWMIMVLKTNVAKYGGREKYRVETFYRELESSVYK
jgi:hypothetical protein